MTAPHADQIIDGYLARLEAALATLPAARREELLDDVRTHIAEARSGLVGETDADLLTIIERLGDPAETAAAEMGPTPEPAPSIQPRPSHVQEILTIVFLIFFWPAGVVLLWLSDVWTTRDKVIGTLVPPGAYYGFILGVPLFHLVFGFAYRIGFPVLGTFFALLWLVAPIGTAIYLGVRLKQVRAAELQEGGANSPTPARGQLQEILAIVLLLVFWPVGLVLLWASSLFTTRDKIIGTFVPPGGYLASLFVIPTLFLGIAGPVCEARSETTSLGQTISSGTTCTQGLPLVLLAMLVIAFLILYTIGPMVTAVYLAIRLRRVRDRAGAAFAAPASRLVG